MNAIKADPNNGGARIMQAQVYLALGDGVAAAAEIERARALGISAEDSRHLMAHALLLQNEPKRALAESATVPAAYAAYAARVRGQAQTNLGDESPAAAD